MKLIPIVILFTLSHFSFSTSFRPLPGSRTKPLSWDSTKNWKIYKLRDLTAVVQVPIDSLKFLKSTSLDDDSMHIFLSRAKELSTGSPAWMGCYLTSYETSDGKIRKDIVSYYGGFFYCPAEDTYFQLDAEATHVWLEYLSQSYLTIH